MDLDLLFRLGNRWVMPPWLLMISAPGGWKPPTPIEPAAEGQGAWTDEAEPLRVRRP